MFGACVVYAGLVVAFLGGISILKPLAFLGIHTRLAGLFAFVLGFFVVCVGWFLPAGDVHIASARTHLDEFAPNYQFGEFHSIRVSAPRERVFLAMKEVTADEIFLFRTLTWIRRFGRPGPESIMNAPENQALLGVATRSGFLVLAMEENREIVLGTAVAGPPGFRLSHKPTPEDFKNARQPGFVLAAMNFRFEDDGPGVTLVTTETRVFATSAPVRQRFQLYWRGVYSTTTPLCRQWLRAPQPRAGAFPNPFKN